MCPFLSAIFNFIILMLHILGESLKLIKPGKVTVAQRLFSEFFVGRSWCTFPKNVHPIVNFCCCCLGDFNARLPNFILLEWLFIVSQVRARVQKT